jgi:hypothetical protein
VTFSLGKYKDMNFVTKIRTINERKIPNIPLNFVVGLVIGRKGEG